MQDEKVEKLKEAMNDVEFESKIAVCNSPEELYEVLESKQIGYTLDETKKMYEVIADSLSDELSEAALEGASGGYLVGAALFVGGCYVAGRLYGSYARNKLGYCR